MHDVLSRIVYILSASWHGKQIVKVAEKSGLVTCAFMYVEIHKYIP